MRSRIFKIGVLLGLFVFCMAFNIYSQQHGVYAEPRKIVVNTKIEYKSSETDSNGLNNKEPLQVITTTTGVPSSTVSLESGMALNFKEKVIGKRITQFYQRKIDDAIVEKDFVIRSFNKDTKQFIEQRMRWRDDLPEHLPKNIISKEKAESQVKGAVQFSKLYYISPESDIFPIEPTPNNPCWVVRSVENGTMVITIIDALEGKIVGYGIPPPYTAFSLTGSWSEGVDTPCEESLAWAAWYRNAEAWFNQMGYSTEAVSKPTEDKVRSHIHSSNTALFYEIAHGGSHMFASGCNGDFFEYTDEDEISEWIEDYPKMPFTFIGSCSGMCSTGAGTLSYRFRKGSTENTVTVGYCGMAEERCLNCWCYSNDWQDLMFGLLAEGNTIEQAYDGAMSAYPFCEECMNIVGDVNLKLVPRVKRGPIECGDTITEDTVLTYDLDCLDEGLSIGANNITLDCDGHLIEGADIVNYAAGIRVEFTEGVTIKNCNVRNFYHGINLLHSSDTTLTNNIVEDSYTNGLALKYSENNIISNNIIKNNYRGIYVYNSHNNSFDNNIACSNVSSDLKCRFCSTNVGFRNRFDVVESCSRINYMPCNLLRVPGDYSTIQDAIDAANDGDLILVSRGRYVENIDFLGKAITVKSSKGPHATTIDGGQSASVVTFENGEGLDTVLDGFTITNGYSTGAGGGISCWNASPTIINNIITSNSAGEGGGIYFHASSPRIINNIIASNTAKNGAGINCSESFPEIINSTITGNSAYRYGGAVYCMYSSPIITNTILWNNNAPSGSAFYIYDDMEPIVSYCDVQGGWEGQGNINADPLFVNTEEENYRLSSFSPCIDAANADVALDSDADSKPRYDDTQVINTGSDIHNYVDIGALERQADSIISSPEPRQLKIMRSSKGFE